MLRKICLGLVCASALFSTSSFAAGGLSITAPGINFDPIIFKPHEPQIIANPTWYTFNVICTASIEDSSDDILIEMLTRSGKINGEEISQGQSKILTVVQGQSFTVYAKAGASIRLTNNGEHPVSASCSSY